MGTAREKFLSVVLQFLVIVGLFPPGRVAAWDTAPFGAPGACHAGLELDRPGPDPFGWFSKLSKYKKIKMRLTVSTKFGGAGQTLRVERHGQYGLCEPVSAPERTSLRYTKTEIGK